MRHTVLDVLWRIDTTFVSIFNFQTFYIMFEKKTIVELKEGDKYLRSTWSAPRTFIGITGTLPNDLGGRSHHVIVNCFVHSGVHTEHNLELMTADMQVYVVPKPEPQQPSA